MKMVIEIELGNEAFEPEPSFELYRILQNLRMDDIDAPYRQKHLDGHRKILRDINGNKVGKLYFAEGEVS